MSPTLNDITGTMEARDFKSFFIVMFITAFLTLCIYLIIVCNVREDTFEKYNTTVETIIHNEGADVSLLCNAVNCSYVQINKNNNIFVYKNINGMLKPTTYLPNDNTIFFSKYTNTDLMSIIKYNDTDTGKIYTFYVNDRNFLFILGIVMGAGYLVLIFLYGVLYFVILMYKKNTELKALAEFKNETRNEYRYSLLESVNHEFRVPIEVNKCLLKELFSLLYPCDYTISGICELQEGKVDMDKCKKCQQHKTGRASDKIALDYYYRMMMNMEKIEAIMSVLAGGKRIKHSNGNVSLYEIFQNVMDTLNSFTYPKLTSEFIGLDILKKYAVGGRLSNGDMLNLLNVMVTNSIEAKSRKMEFIVIGLKDNILTLDVKDDGRGIRDSNDNVIPDERIFLYSYSTKDVYGNHIVNNSNLDKFLVSIGIKSDVVNKIRGVGLHVQKGIFCAGGGTIKIHDTTPAGTIFRLEIPVKERRDGKRPT